MTGALRLVVNLNKHNIMADYNRAWAYAKRLSPEQMKKIQSHLISLGYDVGSKTGQPDGIFGRKTYQAILDYQNKYGLKVDGMWGNQTDTVANVLSKPINYGLNYPSYMGIATAKTVKPGNYSGLSVTPTFNGTGPKDNNLNPTKTTSAPGITVNPQRKTSSISPAKPIAQQTNLTKPIVNRPAQQTNPSWNNFTYDGSLKFSYMKQGGKITKSILG